MTRNNIKGKVKLILQDIMLFFTPKTYSPKVFCIGYNKTGTTTLGKSLQLLGYKNSSFNKKVWREYYGQKKYDKILNYTAKFDSFDDLPWLKEDMIPLLDKTFINSKFIYLERDEISWKKSYENWTYKVTNKYPDVEKGYKEYLKHKEFVLIYFENRDNFIRLRIDEPNGFKRLADFLGKPTKQNDFPHYNKS